MSELSAKAAFEKAVGDAVSAAFGGNVPELVKQMVDVEVCARIMASGGSKLGFVFRAGDDERPRVRVAFSDEEQRLGELVTARWPEASEFIQKYSSGHILAETDGGSELRLYVTGIDLGADEAGAPIVGAICALPANETSWLTMSDAAPTSGLTDNQQAYANKLAAQDVSGHWLIHKTSGSPTSVTFFTEQPSVDATLAVAKNQSQGASFKATLDALESGGRTVDPVMLEYGQSDALDITLWGIQSVVRRADDLPEFFEPGSAPDAAAFASHVAMALPDGEREAAEALVTERLYPAIAAALPEGGDAYAHFADAWRWLIGRLAREVPFYRLGVLETVATMASIKAMEVPAYHLALARYLKSHPDSKSDGGLPEALGALSVSDLQDQARALAAELEELTKGLENAEGLGSKQVPSLLTSPEAVADTLGRAVSGDFTAAVGLLHDYFMELGPGGYDDDPSLASLDDIDLEADAAEAAIEEALAMDYDDDDF